VLRRSSSCSRVLNSRAVMAPSRKASSQKARPTDEKVACVVLICGLPGSGKSTLRDKLVERGWSYVSQDELQTADACEKAFIKALKSGSSCIIDRCNVTPSERRLWLQHANRALDKGVVKNVTVNFEAVWMATPPEVCKERARARVAHETLSSEKADEVIDSFCRGLRPPQRSGQEPYDAVHFVASDEDAAVIIRRYANPKNVDKSIQGPDSLKLAVTVTSSSDATLAANAADVVAPSTSVAVASEQAENTFEHAFEELDAIVSDSAEIFILRHGERADRAKCRDGGWSDDPPLTKDGREMAKRAGRALQGLAALPWAPVVYSSPYYRCLQTANEVAAELGAVIRVEPGLSELCCKRIFDQQPRLREPGEAIAAALQRVELDTSVPPVQSAVPEWPEEARDANSRVMQAARSIASRHPGSAVCLICHSHSLVEITRTLPTSGSGATASQAGYCAMSHIDSGGQLLSSLDQTYLKMDRDAVKERISRLVPYSAGEPVGDWLQGWQWDASSS